MEEEKKKAYSEVVEILKLIEDEEKLEKIPFEVIELIKGNSDPSYKPEISKEIPLEDQNLKEQTYVILGWIASKYWGEDIVVQETSKNENAEDILKTDINPNTDIEEKQSQEITEERERSNIRNAGVYNDIEPSILNAELPILLSSLKWYQKLKIQIVKIFKAIFKLNKNKDKEGVNE